MKNFIKNIKTLCITKEIDINELILKLNLEKDLKNIKLSEALSISTFFGVLIDDLLNKDFSLTNTLKSKNIKLLILDVDGVMTDGGMYFTENGDQLKKYNTKDGMAIIGLTKKGFQVGLISSGFKSEMIKSRANLLGIQNIYVGRESKINILNSWLDKQNISIENVAYIGDDINDLEIMTKCGLSACPNDAVKSIKKISDVILSKKGGDACVREFIDEYLLDNLSFSKLDDSLK